MRLTIIQGSQRISVPLLLVADSSCSQLFDGNEYPDSISDLLNSHLLEYKLITLNKVIPRNIID